ncbi:MAG: hypothetical protein WCO29_14515 [Nostocales cyanobacterium ELA583]
MGLTDEGVHVLDPFTGTGTFMVRLLQSGLIKPEDLQRKFTSELHANEIVLLAYYIAAINIEESYHFVIQTSPLTPLLRGEGNKEMGNNENENSPISASERGVGGGLGG